MGNPKNAVGNREEQKDPGGYSPTAPTLGFPQWLKMAQNGTKWSRMAKHGVQSSPFKRNGEAAFPQILTTGAPDLEPVLASSAALRPGRL